MPKKPPKVADIPHNTKLLCYKYLTEAIIWGTKHEMRSILTPEDILMEAERRGKAVGITYIDLREVSRVPIQSLMGLSKYADGGAR